jgi:hypothetical protein
VSYQNYVMAGERVADYGSACPDSRRGLAEDRLM